MGTAQPLALGSALEGQTGPAWLDPVRTALARAPGPARALRELKYYELARISVRDCSERYVPLDHGSETLRALSLLADVLLERALRIASARMQARFGAPRWRTQHGGDAVLAFAVLG